MRRSKFEDILARGGLFLVAGRFANIKPLPAFAGRDPLSNSHHIKKPKKQVTRKAAAVENKAEPDDSFFQYKNTGPTTGAGEIWFTTIENMSIKRMEHVGIVVDDLAAAAEFFLELGLVLEGEDAVEGRWVDRVVGLAGVRADIAMMRTPDGHGRLELTKFRSPLAQGENRVAPANTPGIRHIAFLVEDIDAVVARLRARGAKLVGELERYEDSYRLCYVRGPEGIIVELAEQIG
ncbi:MAG TPA: VOC family protein [Bryobacteraceae bacterium]|nr:VOC family protein [Bryobacteraceae bacterium]